MDRAAAAIEASPACTRARGGRSARAPRAGSGECRGDGCLTARFRRIDENRLPAILPASFRAELPAPRRNSRAIDLDRASAASAAVQGRLPGSIAMQSTGQGGRHSSQPVQRSASTVCIRFAAPTIASTGHAATHSVQPMHAASSIRRDGGQ